MSYQNSPDTNHETKEEAEQRRRVFKPVPASFIFVFDDLESNVLLHRRQNTHFLDGFLDTPSGHEDPNETPKICAVRELTEETGLVYPENELSLFAIHTALQPDVDYRYSAYFVRGLRGQVPVIGEAKKCSEIGMFSVQDILNGSLPKVSPVVVTLLEGYIDFCDTGVVSEKTFDLKL